MNERPKPPINSKDDREPFIIRGHRLHWYSSLTKGKTDPAEYASKIRSDMENEKEVYKLDTLGKTEQQGDAFQQNLENIFTEFINLPGDHPVKLVAGPDNVCASCHIGNHCKLSDQTVYGNFNDHFSRDEFALKRFKDLAETHNKAITVTEEQVDFSDLGPQKTTVIVTTAGIAREVFKVSHPLTTSTLDLQTLTI